MKKWLLAMLFGSTLVLGACGGGDDDDASKEPADKGDANTEESTEKEGGAVDTASAEKVYESNCASCHGADLSGANGPDLTKVGSKLSSDDIADIIENGQGSMPPGMAEGDDVQLLASWLAEKK